LDVGSTGKNCIYNLLVVNSKAKRKIKVRAWMVKTLIVYCSEYKQNTEKLARLFAEKTGGDLKNIRDLGTFELEKYDLIGFGSGVYRESLSGKLFRLAEKLDLTGKEVFVFSTSGVGMKFYNNKLIALLAAKGAIIRGSFACKGSFVASDFSKNKLFELIGKFAQGHPDERDLQRAENFIGEILKARS